MFKSPVEICKDWNNLFHTDLVSSASRSLWYAASSISSPIFTSRRSRYSTICVSSSSRSLRISVSRISMAARWESCSCVSCLSSSSILASWAAVCDEICQSNKNNIQQCTLVIYYTVTLFQLSLTDAKSSGSNIQLSTDSVYRMTIFHNQNHFLSIEIPLSLSTLIQLTLSVHFKLYTLSELSTLCYTRIQSIFELFVFVSIWFCYLWPELGQFRWEIIHSFAVR